MFRSVLNFAGRQFLSAFVAVVTSAKAREAIVEKIKEMELPENTGKPGADKFAAVKTVALAWIKANSGRLVDTIVNALVLLTKG